MLSHQVWPESGDGRLWLLGLGEKVAALGGHLEVVAVFEDADLTLIREPGIEGQPPILERADALSEEWAGDRFSDLALRDPTAKVAVDLTPDERGFVISALAEWPGPTQPTEQLAVAMGFGGLDDLFDQTGRLADALRDAAPLSAFDWRRVLVATEIAFGAITSASAMTGKPAPAATTKRHCGCCAKSRTSSSGSRPERRRPRIPVTRHRADPRPVRGRSTARPPRA